MILITGATGFIGRRIAPLGDPKQSPTRQDVLPFHMTESFVFCSYC